MNYQRLLELFWEFARYLESLHTLYLDSIAGYSILHERLLAHQQQMKHLLGNHEYATEQFQDTCSMLYKDLCDKDFTPVAIWPVMKQGDIKERTKEDGKNCLLLGAQCVVSAYLYWEEYLRIEIGKAIGVIGEGAKNDKKTRKILNKYVVSDLWGDIRLLRNSIIHNKGVANSEIVKCNIFKWFKPDNFVELDYQKMKVIFLSMCDFRNELHNMSLPPWKGIKIPVK
ncbi:MAG: hypothetical protein WC600_09880 [Desulfobaccales bacterium]